MIVGTFGKEDDPDNLGIGQEMIMTDASIKNCDMSPNCAVELNVHTMFAARVTLALCAMTAANLCVYKAVNVNVFRSYVIHDLAQFDKCVYKQTVKVRCLLIEKIGTAHYVCLI